MHRLPLFLRLFLRWHQTVETLLETLVVMFALFMKQFRNRSTYCSMK